MSAQQGISLLFIAYAPPILSMAGRKFGLKAICAFAAIGVGTLLVGVLFSDWMR